MKPLELDGINSSVFFDMMIYPKRQIASDKNLTTNQSNSRHALVGSIIITSASRDLKFRRSEKSDYDQLPRHATSNLGAQIVTIQLAQTSSNLMKTGVSGTVVKRFFWSFARYEDRCSEGVT